MPTSAGTFYNFEYSERATPLELSNPLLLGYNSIAVPVCEVCLDLVYFQELPTALLHYKHAIRLQGSLEDIPRPIHGDLAFASCCYVKQPVESS